VPEEKRVLLLDPGEQQLLVRSLYDLRNRQLRSGETTEKIEDLLLKILDAPRRKGGRRYAPR
jgi:hypothetical protein